MNIADYIKNKLPQWPNWLNVILFKCNIFGSWVYGKSYRHYSKTIDKINPKEKLLEMVNYAIKYVPYYRERYGDLVVRSIDEFEEKIDFIDKDEVMANWDKFIADNADLSKCIAGTTGGTSGKPLKLVNSKDRFSVELAFMHKMWMTTGWKYDLRGVIRNHKLPDSRIYILNPITKELIFDAFRMSSDYAAKIVQTLRHFKVKYIQAYPSAAYQFCKICKSNGLDISFLRCFLCGSEAVTKEQYLFIEDVMGIKVFSWYGHSEKLILGGTIDTSHNIYIEPHYGFFELIDKNDGVISEKGKIGEITGTTFFNRYMPLIRYKTGDYAVLYEDHIDINEYAVLSDIYGRWDKNLIYKKDGTTTSITALNLHNGIYERIDGLQYIQNEIGVLELNIIKGAGYTSLTENELISYIENALEGELKVKIKYVDKLMTLPNGKFLPLISFIN